MSSPSTEWSKIEHLKQASQFLRGQIAQELVATKDCFEEPTANLLKQHGIYQQDDRDRRGQPGPEGQPANRAWIMMVRVKIPGGRLSCEQWLGLLEACQRWGNQTLRITNRQDIQFHGVLKRHLPDLMKAIHQMGLTTLGACGDVARNVLACPAPVADGGIRDQLYDGAQKLTQHFLPRTKAYREIWHSAQPDNPQKSRSFPPEREIAHSPGAEEEPLYGPNYLPRKFKIALGLPEDNCVDIYTNDLGFLAAVDGRQIVGFQVLVGGGLGMTPADKRTFPALAQMLAFIQPEELLPVAEAVFRVFRDFGNRADRRRARLKYLLADWGMERFRHTVEQYYGRPLRLPRSMSVTSVDNHLGWHPQSEGRWFYGLYIENGRVADRTDGAMQTALRELAGRLRPGVRLTPMMSLLLTDISERDRGLVERILRDHGVRLSEEISLVRQYSGACVALPTCSMAITESERAIPGILDQLEAVLTALGLAQEKIAVRMAGCPNGCGRPYNAEIGLVGRGKDKYAIYLGGSFLGDRLGFLYENMVGREEIVSRLRPVLEAFARNRADGETFGDFCHRCGPEGLQALLSPHRAEGTF